MAATLEFRLTGGASNSDPNASLGGVMSSNGISATALNNLFDNVSPSEADAGDVEYRAIDLYNSGDAVTVEVLLWIDTQTPSTDSAIEIGLDSGTQTVADEGTAPSGVTFSAPTEGSPLAVANISNGSAQRIWVKRTISASAGNYANDGFGLTAQYA